MEWRERRSEWLNGGMAEQREWRNGRRRGKTSARGIVQKGIIRIKSKGYEDELQAHFNSII